MHLIAQLLIPAKPATNTCPCEEHPNFWMYPCN